MPSVPLLYTWDGDTMVPHHPMLADKQFVIGSTYRLGPHESRSSQSHNHYFASIAEAWANLPEAQAERFPSPDHLRRWALVKAGYADERSIVCASKAEAARVAAFVRPMDEYAVVTVSESVVRVFTPQSQSVRAMGNRVFQESKTKVLDIVAGLVGVTPAELNNARAA